MYAGSFQEPAFFIAMIRIFSNFNIRMSFRENSKYKISVIDNSYYLIELKDDVDFEVEDMQQLIRFEIELCNKKLPVLVLCPPGASSNSEFIKHLSKNENNPLATAEAFVLSSVPQKIMAHFYKQFVKHERDISFFNNQKSALDWLKQFME